MKTLILDFDGVFVKPLKSFWDLLEHISGENNILQRISINDALRKLTVDTYLEWCMFSCSYNMIKTVYLLKSLSIKTAIYSNNFTEVIQEWLNRHNVKIDYVYARSNGNKAKPSPEGILEIVHCLGGPAIMVGDEECDLIAARNANIPFAFAGWFNPKIIDADIYLESPFDLLVLAQLMRPEV